MEISLAKAAPTIEPVEVPATKSNICESGTLYSFSKKFKKVDWKIPLIPPPERERILNVCFISVFSINQWRVCYNRLLTNSNICITFTKIIAGHIPKHLP